MMRVVIMSLLSNMMSMKSQFSLICYSLLCLIQTVKAKECRYFYENADVKYFTCNIYEFCCGITCCRSTAMTFYQMWYFWLMVFLTILFCSGGGWWYRIRNNEYGNSRGSQVMPQRVTIYAGPTRGQPYMSTNNGIPVQTASMQYPYPPPPPYYGPPPSYDTVANPPAFAPPSAPAPAQGPPAQAPPARQG